MYNIMWTKFFIADNSVKSKLRFGYAFAGFVDDKDEPLFLSNPNNVKLYDDVEEAKKDFNRIKEKIVIWNITINNNQVAFAKVLEKQ
jgi:hypothetical protein